MTAADRERYREERTASSIAAAQIPERYRRHGALEDYDLLPKVKAQAVKWFCVFRQRAVADHDGLWDVPNLVLAGPIGSSKTTVACAVLLSALNLNRLIERRANLDGQFFHTLDLFDAIMRGYDNPDADDIVGRAQKPMLLVLDDIGAPRSRNRDVDKWAQGVFLRILDYRHDNGLPTIVTTNNLATEELISQIGERVESRLFGGATCVEFPNRDFRAL